MNKIHTIILDGNLYQVGYKVVTRDLGSLGLRKNPNIIIYPFQKWYCLPEDKVEKGSGDWGGIWVARIPSIARNLRRYVKERYSKDTRIFKATLDEILYFNSYRIKTNGIMMYEEIF